MVAAQVKFLADGVLTKSGSPSPLPVVPWQNLQAMGLAFSWNSFSADFKFLALSGRGFCKLKKFCGAVGVFLVCGHFSANDKLERLINIVEKRISLTTFLYYLASWLRFRIIFHRSLSSSCLICFIVLRTPSRLRQSLIHYFSSIALFPLWRSVPSDCDNSANLSTPIVAENL